MEQIFNPKITNLGDNKYKFIDIDNNEINVDLKAPECMIKKYDDFEMICVGINQRRFSMRLYKTELEIAHLTKNVDLGVNLQSQLSDNEKFIKNLYDMMGVKE